MTGWRPHAFCPIRGILTFWALWERYHRKNPPIRTKRQVNIHTHVSVPTTPEQREALKSAYGKAITAVPGKSESWLMCPFEDNMPIYFAGDDSKPAAYVEVNVFGSSVPGSAWEKLTRQIMAALEQELGIPQDRTYIRYTATTDWGWNGGNF